MSRVPREIRVCEECATCAMEYGVSDIHSAESRMADRECPRCHSRYSLLALAGMDRQTAPPLLGCPTCYTEFAGTLTPLLRRIHGSTIHKGKTPGAKDREKRGKGEGEKGRSLSPLPSCPVPYAQCAEAEWMQGDGPDCDIVISTRVRLARNILGHVFCNVAEESELLQIAAIVEDAIADLRGHGVPHLRETTLIKLKDLDAISREFLVERHLISRDLAERAEGKREGEGARERGGEGMRGFAPLLPHSPASPYEVILGEKEAVSIMLNEEDHIRLQVINSGLQLGQSWEMINEIDHELGRRIDYAFSSDWGYLTACPTNVGTGLRVSVMFHIPALAAIGERSKVLSSISSMGYAVRGMYGEGSQVIGAFYQISNEATLGQSEEEIIDRIRSVARQIVDRERDARDSISGRRVPGKRLGEHSDTRDSVIEIEDKIHRSYGILMNARLVSSREALDLLSWVSLGVNIGLLSGPSKSDIARLLVVTRPAHLQKHVGRELDTAARDISRAEVIRTALTKNTQDTRCRA